MIVADTNIVFAFYVETTHTEAARKLYAVDSDWYFPAWWLAEMCNVLCIHVRHKLLTEPDALGRLIDAETRFPAGAIGVANADAFHIACGERITAYDARFIAVARAMRTPLVTEDKRLRAACPDDTQSLAEAIHLARLR